MYAREDWPHLLAEQLPLLAQCQRLCGSPALPATCLAILGLPSGALPPPARASACHLLTSVLAALPRPAAPHHPRSSDPSQTQPSQPSQPSHSHSQRQLARSAAIPDDSHAFNGSDTAPAMAPEAHETVDLSKLLLLRPTHATAAPAAVAERAHAMQGDTAQLELEIVSRFPTPITLEHCSLTLVVAPGADNPQGVTATVVAAPVLLLSPAHLSPSAAASTASADSDEHDSNREQPTNEAVCTSRVESAAPSSTAVADTAEDAVERPASPAVGAKTLAAEGEQALRRGCIRLQPGRNRVVFEAVLAQRGVYRLRSLHGRLMGALPAVTAAVEGAATAGGEAWGWLGGAWAAGKGTGWGCIAPRAVLRVMAPLHRMQVSAYDTVPPTFSDAKVANRDFKDFGWEVAYGAVTRRPPNPSPRDCSPYRGLHARRESLGVVHRSRAIFLSCRAKPESSVTHQTTHCSSNRR